MIADLIERAFAQQIVRTVVEGPDGCDEYLLERTGDTGAPVRVWVLADGRFARASSSEGLLTLGQVMRVCGLGRRTAPAGVREGSP